MSDPKEPYLTAMITRSLRTVRAVGRHFRADRAELDPDGKTVRLFYNTTKPIPISVIDEPKEPST